MENTSENNNTPKQGGGNSVIANIVVAILALISFAALALFGYYFVTTSAKFISAGAYKTWVEAPAVLKRAAQPTEDHPYDAIYSWEGKNYTAPNYGRSTVSFDYRKKANSHSAGRRRNRGSYERVTYRSGSKVKVLIDQENPKSYQFDLYKDMILRLCIFGIPFFLFAYLSIKFTAILFSKDEDDASAADQTA